MKKLLLSFALSLGLVTAAQAQVEIGLKVSPSLAYQRYTNPKGFTLENDGSRLHFSGGIVLDYFFGENYAFNTGLELVTKGGNVKASYAFVDPVTGVSTTFSAKNELGLQYLQVPLALKLFTNEVAPDTRVYFQVGGELGALLGARFDGEKTDPTSGEKYSKQINTFEAGALLGAGAEMQMGKSTKVFGGLSYHHGLTDIADDSYIQDADIKFMNSYFALDLGLKF